MVRIDGGDVHGISASCVWFFCADRFHCALQFAHCHFSFLPGLKLKSLEIIGNNTTRP